jgi:hypothetical protein
MQNPTSLSVAAVDRRRGEIIFVDAAEKIHRTRIGAAPQPP